MKLTIKKMGINGEGIAYINKKPIFINGALPNETVEAEITEDKGSYARAELTDIIRKSSERRHAGCRVQKKCGGCTLMTLDYEAQLKYKKELLEEALYKYGNVKRSFVRDIHPSERINGYRTQCKLPLKETSQQLYTGMYMPGSNHFCTIEDCPVHDRDLETARKDILNVLNTWNTEHPKERLGEYNRRKEKGIRYLVIRTLNNSTQCTLVTGRGKIPQELINRVMEVSGMTSLYHSVNTDMHTQDIFGTVPKLLAGEEHITFTMHDLTLQLSADSFFQLNVSQAEKMYSTAVSKIDPCGTLVEAYCGVGAMSLMAHEKAEKVYGIEASKPAIRNAKANAVRNNIDNCEFLAMDAADGLLYAAARNEIDTLLCDPPRSGMDEKMLEAVMQVNPKKIVYVSCNPATLAKNLKVLKQKYHVVTVIPFDLFPQTPLVESVTVLERG